VSLDRRIEALEKIFAKAGETGARSGPDPDMIAIFDELALLRSSQATHFRAGVRIEPTDLPEKLLGPGYSRREFRELAVARALEKRGRTAGEIGELLPVWLEWFDHLDHAIASETFPGGARGGGVHSR
jgi:hypothetical protein